jgi:hypothetical protein
MEINANWRRTAANMDKAINTSMLVVNHLPSRKWQENVGVSTSSKYRRSIIATLMRNTSVDIYRSVYIYIYIYVCVCVCVCKRLCGLVVRVPGYRS